MEFQNILVPMDFSTSARQALRLAEAVATDNVTTIHLCHVLPPPAAAYGEVITDLAAGNYKDAVQKDLNEVEVAPGLKVVRHLVEGDPAKEIVGLAMKLKADLIAIGTHGRTGLYRLLMGSVAEHVLRHAPCPVLAWRKPEA